MLAGDLSYDWAPTLPTLAERNARRLAWRQARERAAGEEPPVPNNEDRIQIGVREGKKAFLELDSLVRNRHNKWSRSSHFYR